MASDRHLAQLMDGAAAWNRWRREEPLVRPDLQGLSLTLAQKQWGQTSGGPINFAQSLLREADLRHATLIDADLSGATLVGADLSGARMRNANLRNADLSQARFDGADLEGAQFAGSNLSGADLGGARKLNLSQIEAAHADANTQLPRDLVAPAGWRNHTDAQPRSPVTSEALSATTAEAYFPSVLRKPKPQGDPSGNRFGRALHGLSRPRLDTVAVQARRSFNELPRPRLDGIAVRVKAVLEGLPRPRPGALAKRARKALQGLPRPRFRLSGLRYTRLIAVAGMAGLFIVFGFGALLALRGLDSRGQDATRTIPVSSIVAEQQAQPEAPAPTLAQRLTVTEAEQPTPVEDVAQGGADSAIVAPVEVERAPALRTEALPDSTVRLAFATRAEDAAVANDRAVKSPIAGSEAEAYIESYVGQPVAARSLNDTMDRTDLPTPKTLDKPAAIAKLTTPEAKPEPSQGPDAPTSVVDYLSMPNKSSGWIKVFIESFYLSGEALNEADLRRIYSHRVDYFGEPKTSLDKVAREKAQYYRDWPRRHYELVPGSIDIKWKSHEVADVSFVYDYNVSAPKKKKASKGRGRAHLTFDLRGHTGLIVREDGELIAQH